MDIRVIFHNLCLNKFQPFPCVLLYQILKCRDDNLTLDSVAGSCACASSFRMKKDVRDAKGGKWIVYWDWIELEAECNTKIGMEIL